MSRFRLISFSRIQIVNVHCHSRFYKTSSLKFQSQNKESYYRILGLSEGADEKEIKQAYFQLAKKYHPDRNKGDKNAQIKFQELTNAYERLTNKNKNTDEEFDFSQRRNSTHSGFSEEYSKEYYENHQQQREASNGIIIRLLHLYYRFREIIWIGSSLGLLLIFRYTLQRQENNNDRLRRQYGLNLNHIPQNDHVRKINPKKNKPVKKTLENTSDKEKNVSYNQSWYK